MYKKQLGIGLLVLGLISALIIGIIGCSSDNQISEKKNEEVVYDNTSDNSEEINESNQDDSSDSDSDDESSFAFPIDVAPSDAREISFKSMYCGFTPVDTADEERIASFEELMGIGTSIILTEDDLRSFMNKYCPGIPQYDGPEFENECAIALCNRGAKPGFVALVPILSVKTDENDIYIESNEDTSTWIFAINGSDYVYFTYNLTQYAIRIIIVDKSELPKNMSENWIYRD